MNFSRAVVRGAATRVGPASSVHNQGEHDMPSTTSKQDQAFFEEAILHTIACEILLNRSIEWIAKNLRPEDVFRHDLLEVWARNNGYVEDEG